MIAGVNYPWRTYGGDFGRNVWGPAAGIRAHRDEIRADLEAIAASGARVVRWFVFTDARGGLLIDGDGWPCGIDEEAVADLDALFGLALTAGLQIVPVLFDHRLAFDATDVAGVRLGGHMRWLADPEGQQRLLDAVIAPLAARYGANGEGAALGASVYAWDLFNEPDWIVRELHPSRHVASPVPFDVFARWLKAAGDQFRRHEAGRLTLGNARLRFARWWNDPAFGWAFLQAHAYYDPDYDFDLRHVTPEALGVSCPLVIAECSAAGEGHDAGRGRPALSVTDLAAIARDRGFAGVWPWSWRGGDVHGPLSAEILGSTVTGSDPLRIT